MFGRRPDATRVSEVSPLQRFMPLLIPHRGGALVYSEQTVRVGATQAAIERWNARNPDAKLTLFQVVLHAIAQALHARPRLNRFTIGGKLWQRDGVWLTFSAKQAFADDAPVITIKRRFAKDETILAQVQATQGRLTRQRGGEQTQSDKEMGVAVRFPGFAVRAALWALSKLDRWGLMPGSMIEADPLYTSVFVANLGSVGLDGGFHHLWEWGNCPAFCVMGAVKTVDGEPTVSLRWTYDERIADGFYAAQGLDAVRDGIESFEWPANPSDSLE